ncbi:MAG: hypothetical protein JNN13_06965 [Planctomycetes bacterium]|nr:hypothetical protein [Planctomycetota bacterium]
MNKLTSLTALAALSCLGACSTLQNLYHDTKTLVLGEKQVVQFAPVDATALTDAAFTRLDEQVPDSCTPSVFVVVNTHKLDAAIEQLSGEERLQVDFSAAKALVREAVARNALAKGWSPPPNDAVEAAARSLGIARVEDIIELPAVRMQLGEQIGKERSLIVDHLLYVDVEFGRSDGDPNKGQFRLTLEMRSVSSDDGWTSESRLDKDLPTRGAVGHIQDWTQGLQKTGLVSFHGR